MNVETISCSLLIIGKQILICIEQKLNFLHYNIMLLITTCLQVFFNITCLLHTILNQ